MTRTIRARAAAIVVLAALAGQTAACGGGNGDTEAQARAADAAPRLAPPPGDPLPPELLGAWVGRPVGDDTLSRFTLLGPSHRFCRELARTTGNCFLGEVVSGGAAEEGDRFGEPRLVSYGAVGIRDGRLVTRIVGDPLPQCVGATHEFEWTQREARLRLDPAGPQCFPNPPVVERYRRPGGGAAG